MANGPKVAVVTGASSGIGAETALAFARRGWAVVLGARRVERLDEVAQRCRQAGGEALVVPTDVAERAQVDHLVDQAVDRFGRLDVMVNNAGYGLFGAVADLDERDLRAVFDVNVMGVWYGLCAAVPVMRRQGNGHIFNVSSVIGKRGTPLHGGYCASKFAVCGLTESARVELRPERIWVTLVCPALTRTEFFSQGSMAQRARSSFNRVSRQMSPAPIGQAIARQAGRYRPEMVFTLGGRALNWLSTLSPRLTDRMMELYRRDLVGSIEPPNTSED